MSNGIFSRDLSDSVRYLREAVKAKPESRQAAIPEWSERDSPGGNLFSKMENHRKMVV